jgi:hypothetical protein
MLKGNVAPLSFFYLLLTKRIKSRYALVSANVVVESTLNHCRAQSMTPTLARGKVGVFFFPPLLN